MNGTRPNAVQTPRSGQPQNAVVLAAHTTSGLAITRSLGRRGVRVLVVSDVHPTLAACSRYSAEVLNVPGFLTRRRESAARIAQRLARLEPAVVFAPTDEAVLFVHDFPETFAGHVCAVPSVDMAEWAQDKAKTVDLARRLGLPVPTTWLPEEYASPQTLAEAAVYPCVVKPRRSRWRTPAGDIAPGGRVHVVRQRDELITLLEGWSGAPPLVQAFVRGEGRGVYVLMEHGQPRMEFAHRRLREGNPRGSGACLAEAVPVDPRLGEITRRLLGEIGWHGVAMVEFKVADEPYIMEINGRFWNSLPLALQAGCDFPWQLFRMCTGHPVEAQPSYRVGARCRSLRGDLGHLVHALRGRPRDWPGWYPTRWEAIRGFLRACLPDVGSYTFAWDDPLPGLAELWIAATSRPVA